MTYSEFHQMVEACPDGVVLLEGRRGIPPEDAGRAGRLGRFLAQRYPGLRFRAGNADGADRAFSDGVAAVDASRLQVVAPYRGHRMRLRYSEAVYDSPESLSASMIGEVTEKTIDATPGNRRVIEQHGRKGPLAAKAAYLIRDTMKVVGHSETFIKPLCGLFYIDLADAMAGGTGHTIRVCLREGVPVAYQDSWMGWEEE